MVITTTLNKIYKLDPDEIVWKKLLDGLNKTAPDDDPLLYTVILDICGLQDMLLFCDAEPQHFKTWFYIGLMCMKTRVGQLQDSRSIGALIGLISYWEGISQEYDFKTHTIYAWDAAIATAVKNNYDSVQSLEQVVAWLVTMANTTETMAITREIISVHWRDNSYTRGAYRVLSSADPNDAAWFVVKYISTIDPKEEFYSVTNFTKGLLS